MTIYYITFILTIAFSYLAKQNNSNIQLCGPDRFRTKSFFVWMVAAVFIFFAGLRYYVGTDWYSYYSMNHEDFLKALTKNRFFEPGWYALGYITTLFSDKFGTAVFFAAFITVSLYILTLARDSINFIFSIVLYFFLVWHGCFNGIRQYLAAAIIFAGHKFIYERKLWKWLLVIAAASLFHVSAVVMVFLYFVASNELNIKNICILISVSIILYFSYDRIFEFVSLLKGKTVDTELDYMSNEVNTLRIIVNCTPILFYFLFIFKQQKLYYDSELNFYSNMALLHALLMIISMNSTYLARVGIYTEPFILLLWPLMLERLDEKSKKMMYVILFLCYGVYWFYDISIHSDLNNFRLLLGNR